MVDSRVKSQCGREAAVFNGEAIVRLYSQRLWITFLAQSRYVNIGLLRKLLVPRFPTSKMSLRVPIRSDKKRCGY